MTMRPRRSMLYMPGTNARAIEKARTLPADGVILDLEDAVAESAKLDARLADLKLPLDIAKNLIPGEQYTKANPQPIKDADAWEATSKKLPQMWNEQVIVEMK